MRHALVMCFNWKILAGLAAVGVAVLVFAPEAGLAVLPLLLLAACPLSMVVMMFAMRGHSGSGSCHHTEGDASIEATQARLAALPEEGQRLELDLSGAAASSESEKVTPPTGASATPSQAGS